MIGIRSKLAVILAIVMLSACSSKPDKPFYDTSHLIPPGKTLVYIYRKPRRAYTSDVILVSMGKPIAVVKSSTYYPLMVEAGVLSLSNAIVRNVTWWDLPISGDPVDAAFDAATIADKVDSQKNVEYLPLLSLRVDSGQVYYYRVRFKPKFTSVRRPEIELEAVKKSVALYEMKNLGLAEDYVEPGQNDK